MKKLNVKKAFNKKDILYANQCVTPTNCSCTCNKCKESSKMANKEIKKIYA